MPRSHASSLTRIWSRFRSKPPARARVPVPTDISVVYAIGDVHGHLEALREIEGVIADDLAHRQEQALVVMLGDYIDRGPDSAGVLTHLVGTPGPAPRLCLCGNHEDLFLGFLTEPSADHPWIQLGGRQTLMSYGLDIDHLLATYRSRPQEIRDVLNSAVPEVHRTFLATLPAAAYDGSFIFVHAGVFPGIPLEEQSEHDLLWIREKCR